MCGSGCAISEDCRNGLVGAGVGLSDGILWFTLSSGVIMVGTRTWPLAGSLGVCYKLNATMCSILGAPDMCSMTVIEYLIWVTPLDE